MLTIVDIARQAGTSAATVSKALNRVPGVRPATRDRILQLARSLNYQPHAGARNLRRAAAHQPDLNFLVAFLTKDSSALTTYPFSMELAAAVERALRERGFGMRLLGVNQGGLAPAINPAEVDGVITRCGFAGSGLTAGFGALPTVVLDEVLPAGAPGFCLAPDYQSGVREAAGRLLAAGHRRLAALTGAPSPARPMAFASQIVNGCRQAYAAAGRQPPARLHFGLAAFPAEGYCQALKILQNAAERPDAIFAPCGAMLGVYRAASECGLRIPDDLSLVGIDGLSQDEYLVPALAAVDIQLDQFARRAAAILLDDIQERRPRRGLEITPTVFRARGSARLAE